MEEISSVIRIWNLRTRELALANIKRQGTATSSTGISESLDEDFNWFSTPEGSYYWDCIHTLSMSYDLSQSNAITCKVIPVLNSLLGIKDRYLRKMIFSRAKGSVDYILDSTKDEDVHDSMPLHVALDYVFGYSVEWNELCSPSESVDKNENKTKIKIETDWLL